MKITLKYSTMKIFRNTLLILFYLFLIAPTFSQCPTGNVKLISQAEVDQFIIDFPNCTKISGKLSLVGNDIRDLSGVSKIKEVAEQVIIATDEKFGSPSYNLDFKSLTSAGSLTVGSNYNLEEINLTNLNFVKEDVIFTENFNIKKIDLPNLSGEIKRLHFVHLFKLESINICKIEKTSSFDLAKNSILNTICIDNLKDAGDFSFTENDVLDNLDVLKNITTFNSIWISQNNNLSNVDVFENITTLKSLSIQRNPKLTNLNGFKNLLNLSGSLFIQNNSSLTDCSSLCNLFNSQGFTSTNNGISNNSSSCNTLKEIKEVCSTLSIEEGDLVTNFRIYPNPTEGKITFNYDLSNANYKIHDILGRSLKEEKTLSNSIDISEFKSGIYFLTVRKDNKIFAKTIVKN